MNFTSPDRFEDLVKLLLEEKYGYQVIKPPKNTFGYDLEIVRNGKSIAVQVKKFKRPVPRPRVQQFMEFMGLFNAKDQFSEGWLISASGFAKTAVKYVKNQRVPVVSLGTVFLDNIRWDYLHPESTFQSSQESSSKISSSVSPSENHQTNNHKRYYFGIFTNKGGTGKTTVAAHLAGAFALMGYDVILLDTDPQRNLKRLLRDEDDDPSTAGLFVPAPQLGRVGSTISVLDDKEWQDDKDNHNEKIIICDCSPTFEENSGDLVKEFDYCVIPTTLNPLGIAKNSDVIKRTFEKIRTKNSKAQMHVLINHYTEHKNKEKRNNLLLNLLKEQIDFSEDKKSYLIDPNICAIHRSDSLYYWGMHILENKEPRLAFELNSGHSVPGEDFRKLADYFRERFEESQMDATQVATAWRRRLPINFGRKRRLLAQPGDFRA